MVIAYEEFLTKDLGRAFEEACMYFDSANKTHLAMRRIAKRLDDLGVPYAVAGAMGMFFHGYRRFTDDVDLLVTAEGLKKVHHALVGLGYLPAFEGSRHLRDTETGVRIEFLVTGGFPGDGKPKPVSFPDPEDNVMIVDGIRVVGLPRLVELKLASGTVPHRLPDLGDVIKMIQTLNLPRELGAQINPFVREKYFELWDMVKNAPADP